MKRGAAVGNDSPTRRSGNRPNKKPRAKRSHSESETTLVRSGDHILDLQRFPDKLRWLLDNETAPEALWWLPEGDGIGINKSAFQEQLLVQEFRGNKFSSITRKLNRWGFRRIDDEERVPKGAIAYWHDFFLQSIVSMMRFMKKEEDRKQTEDEEDAKSSEETTGVSNAVAPGVIGEAQPIQGMDSTRQLSSSRASLAQFPNVGLTTLDVQVNLLQAASGASFSSSTLTQPQLQSNLLSGPSSPNRVLQGRTNALAAALASSQPIPSPGLQCANAEPHSLGNQVSASMRQQLQLLGEKRQQQLLLEESQRQLRRLSVGPLPLPGAPLSLDTTEQASALLLRRGSQLDSVLRSLQVEGHTVSPLVDATAATTALNPLSSSSSSSQLQPLDLLLNFRRGSSGGGSGTNTASRNVSIGTATAAGFSSRAPGWASLVQDPNNEAAAMVRRSILLRQRQEQIEQERLLQLRQQLAQLQPPQVGAAAAAGAAPATLPTTTQQPAVVVTTPAGHQTSPLSRPSRPRNQMYQLLLQQVQRSEEKQQQNRKPQGEGP